MCGRMSRWVDLLPIPIDLTPKCRAPGVVEVVKCAVAFLEPCAKRSGGVVAKTFADVTAILVVHVPHGESGMPLIAFGELCGNAFGVVVIVGIVRTIMPARAMPERAPPSSDGEHLGM